VQGYVHDIEPDSSHVLLSHDRLLAGPLEGSLHGVFDFVQVLHSLGLVTEEVRARGLWAKTPDLESLVLVPLVLLAQDLVALLHVHLVGDDV